MDTETIEVPAPQEEEVIKDKEIVAEEEAKEIFENVEEIESKALSDQEILGVESEWNALERTEVFEESFNIDSYRLLIRNSRGEEKRTAYEKTLRYRSDITQ